MEANLTRLKMDKEFLENLEKDKNEAIKNEDIVKLYDVLDTYLALDKEDKDIDILYQKIVDIAFDTLAQMLSKGEIFDLSKDKDLYTARAIFEHAIERWDRKDFIGSKELFLLLSYLIQDEDIQKGMFLALGATAKKISLDEFIDRFIDKAKLDESSFFFNKLTNEGERFLKEESSLINKELKKIEKLSQGGK
ncbi:hypothetical protein [Nitrosophilus kaiyonis]|uniref:hypothetical protein n=1 Tax=Nitrosophilus kaiyonis TaxID=2930200 RepID=UPI002492EB1D|nr:hypothetical protein [Nitrosophilus kaiyonis]